MTNPDEPKRVPEPKLPRKRRSAVSRVFRSFFVLGLLALLVAGTAAVYAYQAFDFSGPLDANKVVTIERGLGKGVRRPRICGDVDDKPPVLQRREPGRQDQ